MAEHVHSVLCQRATMDAEGLVNLEKCVEGIRLDENPPVTPQQLGLIKGAVTVVSLWRRSDPAQAEDVALEVRLVDPAGVELGKSAPLRVDLTSAPNGRVMAVIEGFVVRGSGGLHFFDVWAGTGATATRVARLPLDVTIAPTTAG